ncbi:MAG: MotA/TolQ/ExbB proton channel family protein [Candidatus Omnitrophota bacterium]|jgi:biopolymer transport protein TolQ|nr:MAG: MotA/TolQ/ExbB proton channel family protein [Candidatus Omnitrophota bacterium]
MQASLIALVAVNQIGNVFHHVFTGSLLGKLIYLSLFLLSVATWSIILKKISDLRAERKRAGEFRTLFNRLEGDIVALSQEGIIPANSPARLFVSAYEELRLWATLDREHNCIVADRPVIPALERTLDRAIEIEKGVWERGTTFLATTASSAPLLGLLGTVWGIYMAFQEMGNTDSASLSTVAPALAEALLTTVAGLLVAIPAVFAHNGILRAVRNIENQLESFANEIINHFDRQVVVGANPANRTVPKIVTRKKTNVPAKSALPK